MNLAHFVSLFIVSAVNGASVTNYDKLVPYESHGYYFHKELLNHADASEFCKNRGMKVATVYSHEHNTWLHEKASKALKSPWWIGLNDMENEGIFQWADKKVPQHTEWNPENTGQDEVHKDCVIIGQNSKSFWVTTECSGKFPVICESETCDNIVEPPLEPNDDGNICKSYEGKGFLFHHSKMTYLDAAKYCSKKNMKLISISSEIHNTFIYTLAISIRRDNWLLGLNDIEKKGIYKWDSGMKTTFANFKAQNMSNMDEKNCVEMGYEDDAFWSSCECGKKNYFVCESEFPDCRDEPEPGIVIPIPPGLCSVYETRSYVFHNKQMTYKQAEKYCSSKDMSLVKLYSYRQNMWIYNTALTINFGSWWIGANLNLATDKFIWWDKSRMSFENFFCDANEGNGKQCAGINTPDKGKWRKIGCQEKHQVICESQKDICKPEEEIEPPTKFLGGYCGLFKNRAYVFYNIPSTQSKAKKSCSSIGMSLTKVDSKNHNVWLYKMVSHIKNAPWWIGLEDRKKEGVHKWVVDNSSNKLSLWHKKRSDNSRSGDCVSMNYFHNEAWSDNQCGDEFSYICETKLNSCEYLPTRMIKDLNSTSVLPEEKNIVQL